MRHVFVYELHRFVAQIVVRIEGIVVADSVVIVQIVVVVVMQYRVLLLLLCAPVTALLKCQLSGDSLHKHLTHIRQIRCPRSSQRCST